MDIYIYSKGECNNGIIIIIIYDRTQFDAVISRASLSEKTLTWDVDIFHKVTIIFFKKIYKVTIIFLKKFKNAHFLKKHSMRKNQNLSSWAWGSEKGKKAVSCQ